MFNPKCPDCGAENLEVVFGTFTATGMELSRDGFSFMDAQQVSTEDEKVLCRTCHKVFGLEKLLE